jgi:hypothetical protein
MFIFVFYAALAKRAWLLRNLYQIEDASIKDYGSWKRA